MTLKSFVYGLHQQGQSNGAASLYAGAAWPSSSVTNGITPTPLGVSGMTRWSAPSSGGSVVYPTDPAASPLVVDGVGTQIEWGQTITPSACALWPTAAIGQAGLSASDPRWSYIDNTIAKLRKKYGRNVNVRLRVMWGPNTPHWMVNLCGTPWPTGFGMTPPAFGSYFSNPALVQTGQTNNAANGTPGSYSVPSGSWSGSSSAAGGGVAHYLGNYQDSAATGGTGGTSYAGTLTTVGVGVGTTSFTVNCSTVTPTVGMFIQAANLGFTAGGASVTGVTSLGSNNYTITVGGSAVLTSITSGTAIAFGTVQAGAGDWDKVNSVFNRPTTLVAWWDPAWWTVYIQLMKQVVARYDQSPTSMSDPRYAAWAAADAAFGNGDANPDYTRNIGEFQIGGLETQYAEPYTNGTGDNNAFKTANQSAYQAAGYLAIFKRYAWEQIISQLTNYSVQTRGNIWMSINWEDCSDTSLTTTTAIQALYGASATLPGQGAFGGAVGYTPVTSATSYGYHDYNYTSWVCSQTYRAYGLKVLYGGNNLGNTGNTDSGSTIKAGPSIFSNTASGYIVQAPSGATYFAMVAGGAALAYQTTGGSASNNGGSGVSNNINCMVNSLAWFASNCVPWLEYGLDGTAYPVNATSLEADPGLLVNPASVYAPNFNPLTQTGRYCRALASSPATLSAPGTIAATSFKLTGGTLASPLTVTVPAGTYSTMTAYSAAVNAQLLAAGVQTKTSDVPTSGIVFAADRTATGQWTFTFYASNTSAVSALTISTIGSALAAYLPTASAVSTIVPNGTEVPGTWAYLSRALNARCTQLAPVLTVQGETDVTNFQTVTPPAVGSRAAASWGDAVAADFTSLGLMALGFKNQIRNANCDIDQRNAAWSGTAITATASTITHLCDGWVLQTQMTTGSVTPNLDASTLTGPVPFLKRCVEVTTNTDTSGTATQASLRWQCENVQTLAGETVTFSFQAAASTGTPNVAIVCTQYFGSGGSTSVVTAAGVVALSSTLAQYSVTFTVPAIAAGQTYGPGDYLEIQMFLSAATGVANSQAIGIQNNSFWIAQPQLEAGNIASTFEYVAPGVERIRSQRYYYRITGATTNDRVAFGSIGSVTTAAQFLVNFPPMRVAPTFNGSGTWNVITSGGGGPSAVSAWNTPYTTLSTAYLAPTIPATGSAATPSFLVAGAAGSAYLEFSAELV